MSVKPNYNFSGIPQLIVQRGKQNQLCFYVDKDYQLYLELLSACADEFNCQIHAYILMQDHVYILATPNADSAISHMMQTVSQRYASHFNKTYGSTGSPWEGSYKSCLLESQYGLFNAMRYIELNPARIEPATNPEQYRWSSYAANALNKSSDIIRPHAGYMGLSDSLKDRCAAYRAILSAPLSEIAISEIREALDNQQILGSAEFKEKIEQAIVSSKTVVNECTDCVMYY